MNNEIDYLDKEAIKNYIKNREFELEELEPENIKKIYEIIKIMKNLSDREKEQKRYEIRNLCK